MATLITRVYAIIQAHPDGILSADIRAKLDADKPHERCMVAHVLTQLHRAELVVRAATINNSAKTYFYKASMSTTEIKSRTKATNIVLQIIKENPRISSQDVRQKFGAITGQHNGHTSVILSNLFNSGRVLREKNKSVNAGCTFIYWLPRVGATFKHEAKIAIKAPARIVPLANADIPLKGHLHVSGEISKGDLAAFKDQWPGITRIDPAPAATTPAAPATPYSDLFRGMELAAKICELQAQIHPGNDARGAVMLECAQRIRSFAV